VVILTGGGGGYGDALDRDPALVAEDVASGLVTEDGARDCYGVVLREGRVMSQDTAALRSSLKSRKLQLSACASSEAFMGEVVQVFHVNAKTRDRAGLADGSLVEISTGNGAPLRGRLRTSANVPEGSVALNEDSLEMLGTGAGDVVEVRSLPLPSLA
jgi:N-methylhydantoinase B